jgi:hypothetical protein
MTSQNDSDNAQANLIATLARLHEQAELLLTPERIEAIRTGITEAHGALAACQATE